MRKLAHPPRLNLSPPTDADIAALLTRLQRRVQRLLVRRGRRSEAAEPPDPFAAQEPLFASAVAASLQGRVALGPRAGQPVRRLRSAAAATAAGPRCARLEGCSLHADVACRRIAEISWSGCAAPSSARRWRWSGQAI